MRLLVVEDERALSDNICAVLKQNRYDCEQAYDGEEALDRLYEQHFDLVLLDIMLPKMDGIELIRSLREADNDITVLMLSARDRIEDKVAGLDAGADDYLAKPFSNLELLARIRSLLRRTSDANRSEIHCGNLLLDERKQAVYLNGDLLEMTAKEYRILELFMHNQNTTFTRLQLSEYLWGEEGLERSSNAIDAHMKNLRKKIGPEYIETIRAIGYVMRRRPA